MSMNATLKGLDKKYKRRIVGCLYSQGFTTEDIDVLIQRGKVKDIVDYMELEDIFYN